MAPMPRWLADNEIEKPRGTEPPCRVIGRQQPAMRRVIPVVKFQQGETGDSGDDAKMARACLREIACTR